VFFLQREQQFENHVLIYLARVTQLSSTNFKHHASDRVKRSLERIAQYFGAAIGDRLGEVQIALRMGVLLQFVRGGCRE
jgi:hypothetical protein